MELNQYVCYACRIKGCKYFSESEAQRCERENHLDMELGLAFALHAKLCKTYMNPGDIFYASNPDINWAARKHYIEKADAIMKLACERTFHGMSYFEAVQFMLDCLPIVAQRG